MGDEKCEKGVVVLRQYEDFEFLSHCLSAHNDISSVVVFPLKKHFFLLDFMGS